MPKRRPLRAAVLFAGIVVLVLTGAATASGSGVVAAAINAVGFHVPRVMSTDEMDRIPVGKVAYGPRVPTARAPTALAAQAPACTLAADIPYTYRPGRRVVEGWGWQSCAIGLNQRTRWQRTRCGRVVPDRRPTFRPVAVRKVCIAGTGTWTSVIYGSIYVNGPNGPGRYSDAVRSDSHAIFGCN